MDTNLTFEQALQRLEEIVKQLESGDVSLDKSLEIYQEGIILSKFCSQKLNEAEGKVMTIMNKNGNNMEEFKIS
ncbi:MAG: exodeoxyribonuclease VII small subunit [Bacillota bacterium]